METVVTDMHQRVTALDRDLESMVVELNEKTAALIARVSENERQIRMVYTLMEENQRKIDILLEMLRELKVTLYRHWGLDPGPEPAIRPRGGAVRIEPPARTQPPQAERVQVAPAAAPPQAAAPSIEDSAAYARAKALYDAEDYTGALVAFGDFLAQFPRSDDRDKAQFWIGKSHLNRAEYTPAIRAFESMRENYPQSSYMAFALHNQAVAHFRLGERETAVALMEEVVANYPTTTAADHARRDLEQLRRR